MGMRSVAMVALRYWFILCVLFLQCFSDEKYELKNIIQVSDLETIKIYIDILDNEAEHKAERTTSGFRISVHVKEKSNNLSRFFYERRYGAYYPIVETIVMKKDGIKGFVDSINSSLREDNTGNLYTVHAPNCAISLYREAACFLSISINKENGMAMLSGGGNAIAYDVISDSELMKFLRNLGVQK